MTLTLDLPKELEQQLTSAAMRLGLPVEQYALRLLGAAETVADSPQAGAELVAYWEREGIIGSRPDIQDSQTHAREIRRKAERRSMERVAE